MLKASVSQNIQNCSLILECNLVSLGSNAISIPVPKSDSPPPKPPQSPNAMGHPGGLPPLNDTHDILALGESPDDLLAENVPTSSITSASTAILVVGGIVGSLIAVKTSSTNAGFLAGAGVASAPFSNPKTGGGSGQSIIDAVTLLLHFQSISTSGLLSISYPAIYRFFSYNFVWANLIIAPDAFKDAVRSFGANPSCLKDLGSLKPGLTEDPYTWTGMTVLGQRYDLDRATLGGLVYLSAIIGVAIALAVSVLVTLVLHTLNAISKSTKLQTYVEIWPLRASSMCLRLVSHLQRLHLSSTVRLPFLLPKFIWVLGSVSTFAIYQFAEPCSGPSLMAFASVEFAFIILTLLVVSMFIIKTANAQGHEALFWVSESEESKYSRKWGTLYAKLKPALYWFFIPDYIWVLAKSIIVGVGQVKTSPLLVTCREGLMFFFAHNRVLEYLKSAL